MPPFVVVIDSGDPDRLADFWAAALGYEKRRRIGPFVGVRPSRREWFTVGHLVLQQVPEPKVGKNRVHIDIEVADIEAEAARLEQLGARRLSPEARSLEGTEARWIVMADPEGNEFCVAYDELHGYRDVATAAAFEAVSRARDREKTQAGLDPR
jgi:predicted enzyme related to lactoylglutathione lyase